MATSYALTQTVAPTTEPVLIEEVCRHCRLVLDAIDNDQFHAVWSMAQAARDAVETRTGLALMTAQYTLRLSGWGDVISIPRPPLQSVQSVKYLDLAGVEQTLSTSVYRVHSGAMPGLITLAPCQTWPDVEDSLLPVSINFTAGYTSADRVPMRAKQAILLLTSHWYEHREAVVAGSMGDVPLAFESLIKSLVVGTGWVN